MVKEKIEKQPVDEVVEKNLEKINAFIAEVNKRYFDDPAYNEWKNIFPKEINLRPLAEKYTAEEVIDKIDKMERYFPEKFCKTYISMGKDDRAYDRLHPKGSHIGQFNEILEEIDFFIEVKNGERKRERAMHSSSFDHDSFSDIYRIPFLDQYFRFANIVDKTRLQQILLAGVAGGSEARNVLKSIDEAFKRGLMDKNIFQNVSPALQELSAAWGDKFSSALNAFSYAKEKKHQLVAGRQVEQILSEFSEATKSKISPSTYLDVEENFLKNKELYSEIGHELTDVNAYIIQLGKKYNEAGVDPNDYLEILFPYNKELNERLGEFGFNTVKKVVDIAVENKAPPSIVSDLIYSQYQDRFRLSEENEKPPTKLQEIMSMEGADEATEVAEKIFQYINRVRENIEYKDEYEMRKEEKFLLDKNSKDMIASKGLDRLIQFGDSLLELKIGLSQVLAGRGEELYEPIFDNETGEKELTSFFRELSKEEYKTWDRYQLLTKVLPESNKVIQTVGLDNFKKVLQHVQRQKTDPVLIFQYAIPAMGKVFLQELKDFKKAGARTNKEICVSVLDKLELVKDLVKESDLKKVKNQIKKEIDRLAQAEISRLLYCVDELGELNKILSKSSIDHSAFYEMIGKQKYFSYEDFKNRSYAYLKEITEAQRKEKDDVEISWSNKGEKELAAYEKEVQEKKELFLKYKVNFMDFLYELQGHKNPFVMMAMWNTVEGYDKVLMEIITRLPALSSDQLKSVLEKAEKEYENIGQGAALELKKILPAKGIKITELGGYVAEKILSAVGAEMKTQDAGMDGSIIPYVESPKELVHMQNWKTKLSKNQDFSLTNRVFDRGSGVGDISEPSYGDDRDVLGAKELLIILHNITKEGGYTFHSYDSIGASKEFLSDIGWEEVKYEDLLSKAATGNWFMTIYRKVEPRGKEKKISLGRKKVTWNEENKEWEQAQNTGIF